MSEHAAAVAAAYEDMPFFRLLFRYLWPFWLFRDATRGDRMARAAAYRHNQRMRIYLPGYLLKWTFSGSLAFAATAAFESLALRTGEPILLTVIAAGAGVLFAASLCMLVVTSYIYLHLGKYDY